MRGPGNARDGRWSQSSVRDVVSDLGGLSTPTRQCIFSSGGEAFRMEPRVCSRCWSQTAPLAAGFSSPAIGSLMDRYGERRIMIAGAGTMVALQLSGAQPDRFSCGVLCNLYRAWRRHQCFNDHPSRARVITSWFRKQRGLALGIAFAGIPLGGTGITILASRIVQRSGFQAGYFAMAIPDPVGSDSAARRHYSCAHRRA